MAASLVELAYEIPVSPHAVDNTCVLKAASCGGRRDRSLNHKDILQHINPGQVGCLEKGVGALTASWKYDAVLRLARELRKPVLGVVNGESVLLTGLVGDLKAHLPKGNEAKEVRVGLLNRVESREV